MRSPDGPPCQPALARRTQVAVDAGWRRFWPLPMDLGLIGVAATAEVAALVASVQPEMALQRARVEREAG